MSESVATAQIEPAAGGRFLSLRYTWSYEGVPQDGLILLGVDQPLDAVTLVWVDSWHTGDQYMICHGKATEGGQDVKGSYAAPPGPDWGWRIQVGLGEPGTWHMIMHNITPDGQAHLAVECIFSGPAP